MSYLVLARKYRPQTFTDMIGQEHVVRTLTNAIRQDRVAHAFLFTGARGVGKTTSARLMAKALNCESGPTPEPCGTCGACKEIALGTSVDVQEIDGASNNGVDQVRELRENARYLPSRDRHKIYIIDEVHMLSGAAFNALLKTLEEPPAHVKFIFATTEPHKIPVTILSRTQRFDFRRIPLSQIIGHIGSILAAEQMAMSPRAVALVARQAEGSMRDALSLLDQVISAGGTTTEDAVVEEILGVIDRTEVAALAGALMEGDGSSALEIVGRVFDRGLDLARLAEDLAWHFRNLMVLQIGGKAEALIDVADHEREGLAEQASQASPATLAFLFDSIHGAIPEIGRAVQPRLAVEVALLKAIHMAPGVDLAGLVARVEQLAAAMGAGRAPSGSYDSERPQAFRTPTPKPAPAIRAREPEPPPPPAKQDQGTSSERASAGAARPGGAFGALAARLEARAEEKENEGEYGSDGPSADPAPATRPLSLEPPPKAGPAEVKAGNGVQESAELSSVPPPSTQQRSEPAEAPQREKPPAKDKPATHGRALEKAPSKNTPRAEPAAAQGRGGDGAPPGPTQERLAVGDDSGSSLEDRYTAFVAAVTGMGRRPFLGAALEHARPLSITDEEMVLALPRGIYFEGLNGAANHRAMEMLIEEHFGSPRLLRVEAADEKDLSGVPEAIATIKERRLAEEGEAIRTEAMENPAVRLAVETLDGEIEAIRILRVED